MKRRWGRWIIGAVVVSSTVTLGSPAQAEWNAGVEAYKKKDYTTAIKEFEQVTQTNPEYAGAYYMLGVVQNAAGKASSAVANARKAVELDGANSSYKVFLGQVLLQTEQYREAYTTLNEVGASNVDAGNRSRYVLLFALAATKSGNPGEAVNEIKTQLRADGNNGHLYQALGEAYGELNDDKQRFSAFKRAFELNSKDKESAYRATTAAIAVARRAVSASEKKKYYSDAGNIGEQLCGLKGSFENYLLTGEAWLGAKEYSKALQWFSKAKSKNSRDNLVYFYSGQCYSSLGQFDKALSELQEALGLGATGKLRKQIYNQMGYVYAKKKDYSKAKDVYAEAGNQSKVAEMEKNVEAAEQNQQAEQEKAEFERKLAGLRMQIQELRNIGEDAEADELQKQLNELEKALK